MQATRAARLAVINARTARPEPYTAAQTAAYRRDYQAADRARTEARARLALQVEAVAEGEGAVT